MNYGSFICFIKLISISLISLFYFKVNPRLKQKSYKREEKRDFILKLDERGKST